jgi:hypothetical protein
MPVKETPAGAHWEFPAPEERYLTAKPSSFGGRTEKTASLRIQIVEPMGLLLAR